ncbi:hypothetical protein IEQ34_022112 [Dendrobium chrysotoxum]|uniref:Uncharacterized protein n=1 Tax=Dendrobium chrysotoxum TaxID=161865 RepID=A0AAV7FY42_DENCH|nr:hypothetical protein IEQ34_022112 [Dendrobium chrysotoxum]
MVTIVPKRSDRDSLPPPGYLTFSEINLRAGLRFPPPAELIKILRRYGVNLSQFSFRAMSVTMGLIALFRNRGATLTPKHLSRMGRFTSDTHGLPDIEHLLFEVRHISRYTKEEFLFKSIAFNTIIQDHVQEAQGHIYDIEVKALEQQCIEDGFIRGFLKGVCLMQRKAGVQVEGVTPSQASDDFPSDSNGDEIESELQKAFDLDVDDETVNIE